MAEAYAIYPIGVIHQTDAGARIEIYPAFTDGLLGLEQFSHITVLYWLHHNDTPRARSILQVHPRKNPANPLTGVFATHSPRRPNPVALSRCRILAVTSDSIVIDRIDAEDGSPVIDIKSFFPYDDQGPVKVPAWQ
ncbi:MAG: tRNA (N6-threonylcarbamoyladenosine(37)-N6)-methyltransferase TrmO [Desulfobacterales bacterium]